MAVRREYVESLYRDLLGRPGSAAEVEGHLNNPGGEEGLRQFFMGSPEYTSKHGGQATWQDVGGQVQTIGGGGGYVSPGEPIGRVGDPSVGAAPPTTGGNTTPTQADWNRLHGFSSQNYYDPNMNTMKYQFARIAADYDPTQPGAIGRLVNDPRFRAAFPNARLIQDETGDKIDFGGQLSEGATGRPVGIVDVGEMFTGGGGRAWQWLDQVNDVGGGGAGGAGGTGTMGNLRNAYQQLGQIYGGPGGPGITNGPLEQVGQDPFSQLLMGALANFIGSEGTTTFGGTVQDALAGLLERGGELPDDQIARRYESARELLDKGRRTMLNDVRGDLANRNLLSEPGIPQGAEIGAVGRITERLAPEFSRALRDIYSDESAKSDARMMTALQMATGFSTDQARNLLAGIGEGTARQTALADLALRNLQTNMAWSQFLAEFGLKREQVMWEMENGGIEQIIPLLQAFLQLGGLANQGYV